MPKAFYTQDQRITIYALVCRREASYVYLGKTASPRVSAVFSAHRRGRVAATRGYCDLAGEPPELYILERLRAPQAQAYRHVLAWLHRFEAAGYLGINHDATLWQSEELLPETEEIYRQICATPLEICLQRGFVSRPRDANLPPEPKLTGILHPRPKTAQMTLRMEPRDRQRFRDFCRERGLNQRQGFALLLEQEGESMIYEEQAKKLKKTEAQLARLEAKLADFEGRGQKAQAAQDDLAFLLEGLGPLFDWYRPEQPPENPVPKLSLRAFRRSWPQSEKYHYPPEPGYYRVVPEALTWGRSKAEILMCRGEQGERYRMRIYPRKQAAGYSFRQPLPVGQGVPWLVGVRQARDGVDVYFSVPLLPREPPQAAPEDRKPSLDDLICQAQTRT